MQFNAFPFRQTLIAAGVALAMSGCVDSNDSTSANDVTVSGTAVAGAVDGTVTVTDSDGNQIVVGTVTNGVFTVTLPQHELAKALRFIVTGSYVDEVSGETVNLTATHPLALSVAAGYFEGNDAPKAPVTPDTTIIHDLITQHGMTQTEAQNAFQNAFGYLPDMDAVPFDPSLVDETSAANRPMADRNAAFRAGVMSQLANQFGLAGDDIAELLSGLADDLADGSLDGMDGNGAAVMIGSNAPVNLQATHQNTPLDAQLVQAYGAFAASDGNSAALAAPSMGLPTMAYDASGTTKTVTLADGREVNVTLETDYSSPFMNGFWTARVNHKITITNAADGTPIDVATDSNVKAISHHPMMYMLTGHDHTTPHSHSADLSDSANGHYNLDAYYLMASAMSMGDEMVPMGVWEYALKIKQDTDNDGAADTTTEALFYPQVKMPMDGSVLYSKVSNPDHTWTDMMGMTKAREYRIWLQQISANSQGGHDLTVFVSTRNMANMSGMMGMSSTHGGMSFPVVYSGQTLNGPLNDMNMRPEITLAAVTVEVSTDGGTTWTVMTELGDDGLFSASQLSGLGSSEAADTIDFRLTVNDGTSDYVMTTAGGDYAELTFIAP